MTQMLAARSGKITPEMEICAQAENISPELLRSLIAEGQVIIPCNKNHHDLQPVAVGRGLKTKVNANIGTSQLHNCVDTELRKQKVALASGADAIMDLSTAGDLSAIRRTLIAECPVMFGTVPLYQASVDMLRTGASIAELSPQKLLDVIAEHAATGVDFVTVHCGVTRAVLQKLRNTPRVMGVISRGGSLIAEWITKNDRENPLLEHYDQLLDICLEHDVCVSLGDGLRPGCLEDASDPAQFEELMILGELTKRAWARGVQVMIEGPGHMPMDQIEYNIKLQKRLCHGAPFYVLGPLVTDVAPGYDHISAAIGGTIAAAAGADFLCYVTPAEHLTLPDEDDVYQGMIATRLAAHSADIVKGVPGAKEWDRKMALARRNLDWPTMEKLAIDPSRLQRHRKDNNPDDVCAMCGDLCAIKTSERCDFFSDPDK